MIIMAWAFIFFTLTANAGTTPSYSLCRVAHHQTSCLQWKKDHPSFIFFETQERIESCLLTETKIKKLGGIQKRLDLGISKGATNLLIGQNCDGFFLISPKGVASACGSHKKGFALLSKTYWELALLCLKDDQT